MYKVLNLLYFFILQKYYYFFIADRNNCKLNAIDITFMQFMGGELGILSSFLPNNSYMGLRLMLETDSFIC